MASPLSTMGRRSLLAAVGAAASLVAAVIGLALVGPGIVGFDGGGDTPAQGTAGESLRFGEPGTGALSSGSAGSSSAGGADPAADATPSPSTPAVSGPAPRRAERGRGAGGGISVVSRLPADSGASSRPPSGPDPTGPAEPVARGLEETGAAVGGASEQFGSSASGRLSELNPFVGDAAGRAGSESGQRARQTGAAAGGAVRDLAPPRAQTLE